MNFQESEKYLYSLGNEVLTMKLGLENIRKLLAALGNPEKKYLKIQIAGTNGKGSVCAFLEAICTAAGIKTGMTTSPHLVSVTERIKINRHEISGEDFAKFATKIRQTSEKLVAAGKLENAPTFFEQVTAAALDAFAEAKCELAILETGLGGRYDATTAAEAQIAAITPIDYDHQKFLGETLSEIAAEKAAIVRAGSKLVVGKQKAEADAVIREVCRKMNIKPAVANSEYEVTDVSPQGKFTVNFRTAKAEYANVRINLAGRHQIENAEIAVLAAEILQEYFPISAENIKTGLETADHRGRLEFANGFLFDGAHNIAGAKSLRKFADELIKQKITMIFGAMNDKDLPEIAEILFPAADKLILTMPDNPRSVKPEELVDYISEDFDDDKIFRTQTVENALKIAEAVSSEDDLICVTGSLYLVGEAQKILKNKFEI